MAHPERLRNKQVFSLLMVLFPCCMQQGKQQGNFIANKMVISSDTALSNNNGTIYYRGLPYSGMIYFLFDDSKDTAAINNYKEGVEDGTWKKYYSGGQLKELRTFASGKKTGKLQTWWPGGVVQSEYFFSNNEYEGTCREWNDSGLLIKEMNYRNGHEEGAQKYFYNNGKVRSNYVVINGKRYGLLGTKNCVNVKDSIF